MKKQLMSLVLLMLGTKVAYSMTTEQQKKHAPAFLQKALEKQQLAKERAEAEKAQDVATRGVSEEEATSETIEKQKTHAPAGMKKALEQQQLKGQSARRK